MQDVSEEIDTLQDLGIEGSVILEYRLKEKNGYGLYVSGLGYGPTSILN